MQIYAIYLFKNLVTDKKYIGQSLCVGPNLRLPRIYDHFWYSTKTNNSYFEKSIAKHGKHNFIWTILEFCFSKDEANLQEHKWINFLNTQYPSGYNIASGGQSFEFSEQFKQEHFRGENHPRGMLGKRHKASSLVLKSFKALELWKDPTYREKNKKAHTGKKHSEETKKKIRESCKRFYLK